MNLLHFFFFLIFCQFSFAQQPTWNDQLLQKTEGKKVVRWIPTDEYELWYAVVKLKKKTAMYHVGVYTDYDDDGKEITNVDYVSECLHSSFDRIDEFNSLELLSDPIVCSDELYNEKVAVAEVTQGKKVGILFRLDYNYEHEFKTVNHFFDEISWEHRHETFVPVAIKGKWGLYDFYRGSYLFECSYDSIEDLPRTTDVCGFNEYSAEIFDEFNKQKDKEMIDIIDMDGGNGDGLFKARSRVTKKWGLYQYLGDQIVEAIPMEYDSLYHFPWNGNYTAVFNDGKVGFYLSYWSYNDEAKQSVECKYEDYKRYITDDQIPKLAVKRDGKWGWVDWLTGEEQSEFKYETPDDLPYPYYEQKMWLDE
jgi:hypothetical protein